MADWNCAQNQAAATLDIDNAIAHFGVLIFPGQDLSDAQQIAFSQRFIEIENKHGGTNAEEALNAQINNVSNLNTDAAPLARGDGRSIWKSPMANRCLLAVPVALLSARRKTIAGDEATVAQAHKRR